jgi:hypothetical protein
MAVPHTTSATISVLAGVLKQSGTLKDLRKMSNENLKKMIDNHRAAIEAACTALK